VRALSTLLKPKDVGFEWGSGRSTVWFARRCRKVHSIEHNPGWFEKVLEMLRADRLENVDLQDRHVPESVRFADGDRPYVSAIDAHAKGSFDFAIVDGKFRDRCALRAVDYWRPGGLLILDNCDWYLPNDETATPDARHSHDGPLTEAWGEFLQRVADWRIVWTTSGIDDTAIWFKP